MSRQLLVLEVRKVQVIFLCEVLRKSSWWCTNASLIQREVADCFEIFHHDKLI